MNIKEIRIQNFKGFEDKVFCFNDRMTVLIGDNGMGKTSILDALSFALGTFFIGVDGTSNRPLRQSEKRRLILSPQSLEIKLPFKITVKHTLDHEYYEWYRDTNKVNGGSTSYINAKELINKAKWFTHEVREGKEVNLPLIAYFGAARLSEKNEKLAYAKISSRLDGYNSALEPSLFQRKFLEWFKTAESRVSKSTQYDKLLPELYSAFTNTITNMIPEYKCLEFNSLLDDMLGQLESGKWIPFQMLSDGYKNIVRISADIAYRAIKLNPHLGENAVKETEGVVLIDEIDMHLHPKWQKTIINDLKRTFPKIQFIVTTHSPFIVQSLRADEVINLDDAVLSEDPEKLSLEENALFMGVPDSKSDKFFRKGKIAEEYLRLLHEKNTDETTFEKLDELLIEFSDDPVFIAKLKMQRLSKLGK